MLEMRRVWYRHRFCMPKKEKRMRRATFGLIGLASALILALVAVTLAGIALGRSGGRVTAPGTASLERGTVFVTGTGVATFAPDLARSAVGVQEQGKSVAEAQGTVASRSDAVIATLVGMGIDQDKDIRTSTYAIDLLYDYPKDQAPALSGYRVSNMVSVTVRGLDREPKKVGPILDAVVRAGASTVGGLAFGLSDPEKPDRTARAEAMKNAQRKALELVRAGNASLGPVLNVSDQTATPSDSREAASVANAGTAATTAPMAIVPGEVSVTVTVNVTYLLK
jgi:uncharacterized protein